MCVCMCIYYVSMYITIKFGTWRVTHQRKYKLRNERNRTRNFPVTTDDLDNLQKHIISCISLEDVGGSRECADTPEEEDISFCLYCAVSVNFYLGSIS